MARGTLRTSLGAVLILLLAAGCISVHHATPLRVLFVGNSLSSYNDLPATFATLYRSAHPGRTIEVGLIASNGASVRDHLRSGALAHALSQAQFDLVVLQDLGGWPLCPTGHKACEDSPAALRNAIALVKVRGAQPLWYATWQRLPAAQRALSARNREVAELLAVPYADVGAAMQAVDGTVADRLLHADGHPAAIGTWLAAAELLSASGLSPLPANAPPSSCGQRREDHGLAGECHHPTNAEWLAIHAAVARTMPASAATPLTGRLR